MPSWNDLLNRLNALPYSHQSDFLHDQMNCCLRDIGNLRDGRHVIMYASAFLQKPNAPPENLLLTQEDINGFLGVTYGMDRDRGLSLILHTPGGRPAAADSVIAYLRSKFRSLEVIVPALALSAGTMVCLGADRLVMDCQSELGPIDPQVSVGGGRFVSARAVVELFERARSDVLKDVKAAHVWTPLVQNLGPSLLQEAHSAVHDSEKMVARWLERYMFADEGDSKSLARSAAQYFSEASKHWNSGRRIGRDEARANNLIVEDLEVDERLWEAVMTCYYLIAISFERSLVTKSVRSDTGLTWTKQLEPIGSPPRIL